MSDRDTVANIVEDMVAHVKAAGRLAMEAQRAMDFSDRSYKADNSVVTEADRDVEDFLVKRIAALNPAANIVTEEAEHPFDAERGLTFAVDPIDGTDVYSQGMPSWCISVGLLDDLLVPLAGIIFAPRLELLIVADGKRSATLNGSPLPPPRPVQPISVRSNLMVTSRIHKRLDLSGYIGKIRGVGSAALHLCYPLIYPAVIGALEGPGIHVWDMAAAHAINLAQGQDLRYMNGDAIDYAAMIHGEPGTDVVMAGRECTVRELMKVLRRLPPKSRPDG